MPKFVIERKVAGIAEWSDAKIREASLNSLKTLAELGPGIQWIHSFVTDDKMYCIYYAPDESLIVEHARLSGLPIDRIAAVRRLLDPSNFE
jgi:Nickel responsive protein SCO4226-like